MTNISPRAQDAARAGRLIDAIKMVREDSGLGLKEAKDAVEAFLQQKPAQGTVQSSKPGSLQNPSQNISAVQRGDSPNKKIITFILLALAAYVLLHFFGLI